MGTVAAILALIALCDPQPCKGVSLGMVAWIALVVILIVGAV